MKIPGANPRRPVQSLGRQNIGGPMRVADAQARAAEYEGAGLRALGLAIEDIGAEMKRRADEEAVHEFHVQSKLAQAEVTRLLGVLSQPSMPADAPGMNELQFDRNIAVKNDDGSVDMVPRQQIPMHEVGGQYFERQMDGIRDSVSANFKDRRGREKWLANFELVRAQQSVKVAMTLRERRREARKAGMFLQLDDYKRSGNEAGARSLLDQSFYAATITPDEYQQEVDRLAVDIDDRAVQQAIAGAETQDDINTVMEHIEAGVIIDLDTGETRQYRGDMDELATLVTRVNNKQQRFERTRKQRHDEGTATAVQLYATGRLNTATLLSLHHEDKISNSTLLSMTKTLREDARRARTDAEKPRSNKQVRAAIWTEAATIAQRANEETPASELAANLEATIVAHVTGFYADGTPVPDQLRLSDTDGQQLILRVRQNVDEGYSSPQFKSALERINAQTNYNSLVDSALKINQHRLMANQQQRQLLREYHDAGGRDYDSYLDKLDQTHNPEIFKAKNLGDFRREMDAELMPYVPPLTRKLLEGTDTTQSFQIEAMRAAIMASDYTDEQKRDLMDRLDGFTPPLPSAPPSMPAQSQGGSPLIMNAPGPGQ